VVAKLGIAGHYYSVLFQERFCCSLLFTKTALQLTFFLLFVKDHREEQLSLLSTFCSLQWFVYLKPFKKFHETFHEIANLTRF
jgi:hypothetical protein